MSAAAIIAFAVKWSRWWEDNPNGKINVDGCGNSCNKSCNPNRGALMAVIGRYCHRRELRSFAAHRVCQDLSRHASSKPPSLHRVDHGERLAPGSSSLRYVWRLVSNFRSLSLCHILMHTKPEIYRFSTCFDALPTFHASCTPVEASDFHASRLPPSIIFPTSTGVINDAV